MVMLHCAGPLRFAGDDSMQDAISSPNISESLYISLAALVFAGATS